MNIIQVKSNLSIRKSFNVRFLKSQADVIMSKMRDIMKFAQTVMINAQQEQEC